MLLNKQQEVIRWSMQHNVLVNPELVQLWDQAMLLGEDNGKKAYQEFLNKWQEYQKNPPKHQTPTDWQKQLLQKQQEVIQIAYRHNVTIPHELIALWEQAITTGEKNGTEPYNNFLKKWEEFQKNHLRPKDEPLSGQHVNQTYRWPTSDDDQNNQRKNTNEKQYYPPNGQGYNPYGQWHVNPNWAPNPYNQGYQSPYQAYNYYNDPYGYPYQRQDPYQRQYSYQQQYPYQNYYPYQNPYQSPYQSPYQNQYQPQYQSPYSNPYQNPYQRQYQPGYNMGEPFAGQQLNQWQTALQDTQKEIMNWAQQNGAQVPSEVIMQWEDAMQKGTQEAYEQFIEMWEKYRADPSQAQNMGFVRPNPGRMGSWQIALINQIEGQNIIASMLGLNLQEFAAMNGLIRNLDQNSLNKVLKLIMDTWGKINTEINKGAHATIGR